MKTRTTDFNYIRKQKADFMLSETLCADGTTLDSWGVYSWSCYLDENLSLRYHSRTNRTRHKTKHVFDMTLNAKWKSRKRLRLHFTRFHIALHHRQCKISSKYSKTSNTTRIEGYLIQGLQNFVFGNNTVEEEKLDDGMAFIILTDTGNNRALLNTVP
jgi:hypothetical protein